MHGVDISDNLFADNLARAVNFTYFVAPPSLGGAGPDITVNGNNFVNNVIAIRSAVDALAGPVDATGNAFYGNGTSVENNSNQVIDVSGSVWAVPAGPAATGDDSTTGAGTTTIAPVSSDLGAAFAGATASTTGLTTTVHLGAPYAHRQLVVGGYGASGTFGYVTADGSGDATVTWPAGTTSGAHKVAVVEGGTSTRRIVAVTVPVASYTSSPVPSISGHATVGRTLTAITRTWLPSATLTFQWNADGVAIPSATSNTFVLTPAQAGAKITLTVTANRSGQPPLAKTSAATAPVALGLLTASTPVVTGSRTVGATLTVDPGTWGPVPTTLVYRWLRDGKQISGAVTSTYVQVTADKGHVIQAVVKGSAAGYVTKVTTSVTAAMTGAKLVTRATSVTIPASASVGVPLTITTAGSWQSGATLTYQWRANGVAIKGAIKSVYVPLPADVGKTLTVLVYGAKSGYTTAHLTSNATSAVVTGTFTTQPVPVITASKVGYPASVSLGTWSPKPTSYRYQWAIDGVDVVGATLATYTPTGADLNKTLTVKVTAVRAGFTSASTVSLGKVVANGVFDSVKPKITGTARVGRVLTATTPTWAPKASTLTYQWKLDGQIIDGAVDDIYTVSSEDLGGRLTVTVTGSRLGYANASETSNATAVVTP